MRRAVLDQAGDLGGLISGVQIEVQAHRLVRWLFCLLQRERQVGPFRVHQHHEARIKPLLAGLAPEGSAPEGDGALHVLNVDDDRPQMEVTDLVRSLSHGDTLRATPGHPVRPAGAPASADSACPTGCRQARSLGGGRECHGRR